MQIIEGTQSAAGLSFAIVVSKYHDFVTERLQAGAVAALEKAGVRPDAITVVRVPGAFELPIAARHARAITDHAAQPSWRNDLKSLEMKPSRDGKTTFQEVGKFGPVSFIVDE